MYYPAYAIGFGALTSSELLAIPLTTNPFLTKRIAFLVELFPFHTRAKGITIFQWLGRSAGFVTQFVDPIGIEAAGTFSTQFILFMSDESDRLEILHHVSYPLEP